MQHVKWHTEHKFLRTLGYSLAAVDAAMERFHHASDRLGRCRTLFEADARKAAARAGTAPRRIVIDSLP
jgi:hypothetical protein